MSDRPRFVDELKRRKVVRAVLVYLAGSFATIEAADVVFPVLGLPEWALSLVIGAVLVGLPMAVALAWRFDLTSEGVTRTRASGVPVASDAPSHPWFSPATVVLVLLMLVIGVGAGWMARSATRGDSTKPAIRSIAVVPFENLSTEEENAFFAIGIQDEILTQLQKISELHVISRSSVMRYQPGPERISVRTMGDELGARWIVEGSVARVGHEVRINVQLIESVSDDHVWAEVYEGDLTVQGLLSFQGQLARRIAESLKATIQPDEEARIDALPTENAAAYDLYLQGVDFFHRRREEDLHRALDVFGRAIDIDPDYALAYAGRALTYAVLPFYSEMPVREATTLGLAAAYQALALDSTAAEASAALGDLRIHGEYNLEGAETALRTAIRLKPSYAQAHDWLAEALMAMGRTDEGLAAQRSALQLDPLSRFNMNYGKHLLASGRTDAAIAQLERSVLLDSTFAAAQENLALAYLQAGRSEEAADAYRRYADLVGPEAAVLERVALASVDPAARTSALRTLDAILEPSWRLSAYAIAGAYMRLGEPERGLEWLEHAYDVGDPTLPFAFTSPVFAPLRPDVRFRALAAKMRIRLP